MNACRRFLLPLPERCHHRHTLAYGAQRAFHYHRWLGQRFRDPDRKLTRRDPAIHGIAIETNEDALRIAALRRLAGSHGPGLRRHVSRPVTAAAPQAPQDTAASRPAARRAQAAHHDA